MSLAKKATIFGIAWFSIYLLAYFVFIAPSLIESPSKSLPSTSKRHIDNVNDIINTIRDSFVPEECQIESILSSNDHVGIVIVVHDENPKVIFRTV